MPLPPYQEAVSGQVYEITLGGGTRKKTVTIGGAKAVPFGGNRAACGRRPVIAVDVLDSAPDDWPQTLVEPWADVLSDPAAWAAKAVRQTGADLVCLCFDGLHPDKGDRGADHAVSVTRRVLEAVDVPVALWGSGSIEKDNAVMPKVSQAAKGEKALIGTVTQENYKALTAVALADGHFLIAEAPIDINIAKQVNIFISDMGFPLDRLVMYQTTGALGYGLEYAYSIQERERLAALAGDKLMAVPVICDVGTESWRTKEAKASTEDAPVWGDAARRGPLWEAVTAVALLPSGVDIVRLRHPAAIATVKAYIDSLWGPAK
jgi:acetyl-CoA decarbonylase/synthase, CODH/ACS complex subunit delta